jgi:hypothetical protein
MEELEKEVKKQLKKHLKGVGASTIENLVKRLGGLPYERVLLTTDIGVMLAGSNLKAGVEMLKTAPEVSRLIDAGDIRVWGEVGKRLCATSADTAVGFFQSSAAVLAMIPEDMRSPVLRLVNKQAALSANTAIESFSSAPAIIGSISDHEDVAQILTICLELARHSVKHSNDLFLTAPQVISQIESRSSPEDNLLIKRALTLTSAFAFRSGGTAAEFFSELPSVIIGAEHDSVQRLFDITESYLDRSGGVALQYFKAASRVLNGRERLVRALDGTRQTCRAAG